MELLTPTVTADRLRVWCEEQLGSQVDVELMRAGHLAAVVGGPVGRPSRSRWLSPA